LNVYIRGGPPSVLVNRDPTARLLRARGRRGGLGDAETDCLQPVSTAERDSLRDELEKYAGWGPGTYEQWHEGHPDLRAALDDIGGRMKGLVDRPKLMRCDKEARNRASTWIQQLRELLRKVKSAPNHGWDAAGYTYVNSDFDWSFYRGPTYHIRRTGVPGPVADAMYAFAHGGAPPPAAAASVQSSAPAGSVVVGGQVYASSADERAAQQAAAAGGDVVTTSPTSTTGGVVPTIGGSLPSFAMPSFLEGSIAGIPTKYLALGLVGYMLMKRR
jgi:hypothetical protein